MNNNFENKVNSDDKNIEFVARVPKTRLRTTSTPAITTTEIAINTSHASVSLEREKLAYYMIIATILVVLILLLLYILVKYKSKLRLKCCVRNNNIEITAEINNPKSVRDSVDSSSQESEFYSLPRVLETSRSENTITISSASSMSNPQIQSK